MLQRTVLWFSRLTVASKLQVTGSALLFWRERGSPTGSMRTRRSKRYELAGSGPVLRHHSELTDGQETEHERSVERSHQS